jgi:hypothetical protein
MKINGLMVSAGFNFRMLILAMVLFSVFLSSCGTQESNDEDEDKPVRKSTYVRPSVDSRGRLRKGHVRKAYSTDKNAVRNQARSRYYYHTRGKYKSRK